MAGYHLHEFDEALRRLATAAKSTAADLRDLWAVIDAEKLPEEVIDDYESRRLLRTLSNDADVN